jgi:hypothetical protein
MSAILWGVVDRFTLPAWLCGEIEAEMFHENKSFGRTKVPFPVSLNLSRD